jgi:hypothetical protein
MNNRIAADATNGTSSQREENIAVAPLTGEDRG